MHYLVAVLSDRNQAETAYSELERQKLPMQKVAILGRGYQSADEYGFVDPNDPARSQALSMMAWTIPFGFAAGVTFSVISHLETFIWAGTLGNHIIGGLLGAIGGGMGGLFVGGGVGLISEGGDAVPYRKRLDAGQYLLVVKGTDNLTQQARRILKPLRPQSMKAYLVQDS